MASRGAGREVSEESRSDTASCWHFYGADSPAGSPPGPELGAASARGGPSLVSPLLSPLRPTPAQAHGGQTCCSASGLGWGGRTAGPRATAHCAQPASGGRCPQAGEPHVLFGKAFGECHHTEMFAVWGPSGPTFPTRCC